MTDWSVVLIGSASGAVVGALAGLLTGWLGFRWQRRMWFADTKQRMLERRDDRLQAVLTSVLKYGELLQQAAEAGRYNEADRLEARFDEAQAMRPDLEVAVRLDRMTASLAELVFKLLTAYRIEESFWMNRETLRQQDPAWAATPEERKGVARAESEFDAALTTLRDAVLVVTDKLVTPTRP